MSWRSHAIWRQRGRRIQPSSCAQLSWLSSFSSRAITAPGECWVDITCKLMISLKSQAPTLVDKKLVDFFVLLMGVTQFVFQNLFLSKGSWFCCGVNFRRGLTPHCCLSWNDAFSLVPLPKRSTTCFTWSVWFRQRWVRTANSESGYRFCNVTFAVCFFFS